MVPGVLALVGASVGYGAMRNQVKNLKIDVDKLDDLAPKVSRIDERTLNTDSAVREMKGQVDRLVDHMLNERRRTGNA